MDKFARDDEGESRRRHTRHMHDVTCVLETACSRALMQTQQQVTKAAAPRARTPMRAR